MVGSETLGGRGHPSVSVEGKGLDQASLLKVFSQQRSESYQAFNGVWDLRSGALPQVPGHPSREWPLLLLLSRLVDVPLNRPEHTGCSRPPLLQTVFLGFAQL